MFIFFRNLPQSSRAKNNLSLMLFTPGILFGYGYLYVFQLKPFCFFADFTFFELRYFVTDIHNILKKEQGHSKGKK